MTGCITASRIHIMKNLQELVALLESRGDAPALSWKERKEVKTESYRELFCRINDFSRGFLELGLEPGDAVALFSHNIADWICLSLGLNNAALIDVPRGENTTEDEITYLLEHSQAKAAIVQNATFLDMVNKQKHENLKMVFSIEEIQGVDNIRLIREKGQNSVKVLPSVDENTTASLIYTSGTTALPKGVELTHGNFCSNIRALMDILPFKSDDKVLSILPAWHVLERMAKYISLSVGAETFYSSFRTLRKDLVKQQPTIMASVPRIWETVYEGIMKKIRERNRLQRTIISLSLKAAADYSKHKFVLNPLRILEYPLYRFADSVVFQKLRDRLGGRLRFAISGGSSLPRHIDDFFAAAGVDILEGYGLTETSPVIAIRVPGDSSSHTVGPVLDGIEARIVDQETGNLLPPFKKGVLHVRGANVMKGYYRNFSETSKVLHHDGWFNTGDIGYLTHDGHLVITGREKDILVLSNGENINPVPLEDAMKESEYITEAICVGQEWKHLGVLIVPDFDSLKDFCEKKGILFKEDSLDDVFGSPPVRELYTREIDRLVNTQSWVKPFEKINSFRMAYQPFEVGQELTPTLKPKRAVIQKLYKNIIESLWLSIHQKKKR